MDTKMKLQKSLPPLVEGRIHGYLKFVIDEIIWSARNFGEISVFVSWWGETSRSQFRPADITKNIIGLLQDSTEIYAIRTNINLFEEYVKNCESLELVIVSDETNSILGTSQITDLLEIFNCKPYFRYVPIITNSGTKIGEIHISIKLEYARKSLNTQVKLDRYEKKRAGNNTSFSTVSTFKKQGDMTTGIYNTDGNVKPEGSDIYKSILKSRRTEFPEPINKSNNKVADKLVAQVVERAQRLRGVLLRDALSCNYNSINSSMLSNSSAEDEQKLYEHYVDKDMISSDESKALCTLRSTTFNPNWIDFSSNSLKASKFDNKDTSNNEPFPGIKSVLDDALKLHASSEDTDLYIHVNYVRIGIESLILSPAGYRRVKSSSLSDNDNSFVSATYFVQYDTTFDYVSETGKKRVKEGKPVRISSKKQTNEAIHFNHSNIYRISKLKLHTEHFIKFKIFVRHLNRKLLIELGSATFSVDDVIKNECWKIAKHLSIYSKGIKIGELSVIVELDSDSSDFERQYIDTIMSAKGNIPILETQDLLRSKPATETPPKPINQASPHSAGARNCLTTNNIVTKNVSGNKTKNIDDRRIDTKIQEKKIEDEVLLHGLIYVAEGQELPELNTYLICRAFWREDKTKSQICINTKNPFYQFSQLVPLIYDSNLLERVNDNYIIIEVYSRNNNTDNLLGITKLPVHHLYVSFNDPDALPNLLLSKYPVVSVDGWVPIIDPVSGRSCGELLALVALGTSEQIAFLETSRGLRNVSIVPQATHLGNLTDYGRHTKNIPQSHEVHDIRSNVEACSHSNSQVCTTNTGERESYSLSLESRECQTDISTVKRIKFNKGSEEVSSSERLMMRNIVDRSSENLNIPRMNIDRSAQTEISLEGKKETDMERHMHTSELNLNNPDESDNNSVRHGFPLSTDTYRSVGVGAEYNEEINQYPNSTESNATFEFPTIIRTDNDSINSMRSPTTFRAVVKIECALHLPKVEKVNEAIEPSTYVSFQTPRSDHLNGQSTYMTTDVFPHSCNPKWNWKCDAKLPTELLLHDNKRLILKIWRILDTDVDTQINFERDIVIGFSAIDLSILMNGFPTVSGWFHIMDFTGKCNGQIKVCVTPLDNLSLFGKSVTTLDSGSRVPTCSISQSSWLPLYASEIRSAHTETNTVNYNLPAVAQREEKSVDNESQSNNSVVHMGFEDVSTSFLSLSLKNKLTELDEITQRLQSRLRDVTNAAFEDDLENEFDLNEPHGDTEHNDYKITGPVISIATTVDNKNKASEIAQGNRKLHNTEEDQIISSEASIRNCSLQTYINYNRAIDQGIACPNSSKITNSYSRENISNDDYQTQQQTVHLMQHTIASDNTCSDYPERGTKTHINYLLDKLSLQFPVQPHLSTAIPIRKHMSSLLTNFKQSNNNLPDTNNYDQELKVHTVPTQTDEINEHSTINSKSPVVDDVMNEENGTYESRNLSDAAMQLQTGKKVSNVIREELIAEENNDTSRYDELTTYLVASNIRHMDLNDILNPLLYPHLQPDLHPLNISSEDECIKQLDNQYSKVFSTSITDRLNKVHSILNTNAPLEHAEQFRPTPSGLSENIDDGNNLTVFHKASRNDMSESNNTESTTTLSTQESLVKSIDLEITESSDSASSETSVLVSSRQAPDGGNPIEDSRKPLLTQQKNKIQDSSSSTCD